MENVLRRLETLDMKKWDLIKEHYTMESCVTDESQFLVEVAKVDSEDLPHQVHLGKDDIWCSCIAFNAYGHCVHVLLAISHLQRTEDIKQILGEKLGTVAKEVLK